MRKSPAGLAGSLQCFQPCNKLPIGGNYLVQQDTFMLFLKLLLIFRGKLSVILQLFIEDIQHIIGFRILNKGPALL